MQIGGLNSICFNEASSEILLGVVGEKVSLSRILWRSFSLVLFGVPWCHKLRLIKVAR